MSEFTPVSIAEFSKILKDNPILQKYMDPVEKTLSSKKVLELLGQPFCDFYHISIGRNVTKEALLALVTLEQYGDRDEKGAIDLQKTAKKINEAFDILSESVRTTFGPIFKVVDEACKKIAKELESMKESPVYIRFIRKDDRTPIGVVVALSSERIGWSLWNFDSKDVWNKEEAMARAVKRARGITFSRLWKTLLMRPVFLGRQTKMPLVIAEVLRAHVILSRKELSEKIEKLPRYQYDQEKPGHYIYSDGEWILVRDVMNIVEKKKE